jgi:cytidine deaminase
MGNMKIESVKIQIAEHESTEINNLPVEQLIEAAVAASNNAYAIYSGFMVGAAVLLDNGVVVTGNNQENAAYPSGLCAERVAIFHANASYPDQKVIAVAVSAKHSGKTTSVAVPPCGSCRQVLLETERRYNSEIHIYMHGSDKIIHVESAAQLLPLAFDGSFLKQ